MITNRVPALSLHDDPASLSDHPYFKARAYGASSEEPLFARSLVAMLLHPMTTEWSGWVEVILLALAVSCQASSTSTSTSKSAGFTYSNTSTSSSASSSTLKGIGQTAYSFSSSSSPISSSVGISQSTSKSTSSFSSALRSTGSSVSLASPASLVHSGNTTQTTRNPSPLTSSNATTTKASSPSLSLSSSRWNKNTNSSVTLPSSTSSRNTFQNKTGPSNTTLHTTHTPTKTTSSLLTSCNGQTSLDIFDYLNPTLKAMPHDARTSIIDAEGTIIWSLYSELAILGAQTSFQDISSVESYRSAASTSLDNALSAIWENGLAAFGTFQNMAVEDGCKYLTCRAQYTSQSSAFRATDSTGIFSYGAKPPCCGECVVYADAVELSYWPTPAPTPIVSEIYDTVWNTTLYSPWVHVTVTNMYAWNWCSQIGYGWDAWGDVLPKDLSTYNLDNSTDYTMINFEDYGRPECTCTANCSTDAVGVVRTELCTPQLSMPAPFLTLDPKWKHKKCTADWFGVIDPPVALTAKTGLTPPKTTPSDTASTSAGETSAPTAAPINQPASPTIAPTVDPGITSQLPRGGGSTHSTPTSNSLPDGTANSINSPVLPQYTRNPYSFPSQIFSAATTQESSGGKAVTDGPLPDVITTAPPFLVVGGTTATANPQGSYIIGTQTYTADAQGNVVIGTQTLSAGGSAITLSGIVISVASGATELVLGTQTLVAGGPAITISGTVYSIPPGGTQVVVGGTTLVMTGTGLGAIIISVFGPEETDASTTQTGSTKIKSTEISATKTSSGGSGDGTTTTTKTADSGLGAIIISFIMPGTTSTPASSSASVSFSVSASTKTVTQSAPTYITKSAGRRGTSVDAPGVAGMITLAACLFVLMIWL